MPELIEATAAHLGEYGFTRSANSDETSPTQTHYRVENSATAQVFDVLVAPQFALPMRGPEGSDTILALPFITPAQERQAQAAGHSGFVDASGNAHIEAPGLFVDVRGRAQSPLAREARLRTSNGWSWRPAGLKVLFTLLTRPGSLGLTLSELAELSGTSVATAHRVMVDLTHRNLVDGTGRHRFWIDPPAVVTSWLDGYHRSLADRVTEAGYVTEPTPNEWGEAIREGAVGGHLTSDAALAAIGVPLRAVTTTMYHPDIPRLAAARIRRPRAGEPANLLLRTPWWPRDVYEGPTVPPLLVYADAVHTGDPRVIGAADQWFGGADGLAATVA